MSMSNVSIYVCVCVCMYMYICTHTHHIFIHSSVNAHLGGFHVLAIINSATMNIGVYVSFQIILLSGYMPGMGLLDNMAFYFMRKFHTVFHSSCTNLHSHSSVRAFSFSIPSPAVIICRLSNDGHSDHWYLIAVLICISIINNDNEHLFVCLLFIYMSSLKKYLFMSSIIF